MTVVHVPGVGKRFRCEPYRGAMTGENCIRRQAMARAGDERFGKCRRCKDGLRVARQVTGRAVEWTPCAAEGCRLAASPIHESGLCLTHARERKVEVEDIADKTLSSLAEAVRAAGAATTVVGAVVQSSRCMRDGCKRPPAKSPAKIEGGEGLCREHRGALARAAKKAAEATAPAPLKVPDTEPMAAREKLIAANARAVDSLRDAAQDVESGVRPPEPIRIGDLELPIVPKGMVAAADVAADIIAECDAIKAMLLEKNAAYGNSAFNPLRIFSTADPVEQIRVRIDDKLSRLARGHAAGEDVTADLIGYLVLLRVAQKRRAA